MLWRRVFNGNQTIHFPSYETLKTNLEAELVKVVDFLGLKVTKAKLDCLVRHQDLTATFQRRSNFSFPYNEMQTKIIQTWIEMHHQQLEVLDINVTSWVW